MEIYGDCRELQIMSKIWATHISAYFQKEKNFHGTIIFGDLDVITLKVTWNCKQIHSIRLQLQVMKSHILLHMFKLQKNLPKELTIFQKEKS